MRFNILVQNKTLADNNGGSLVLFHIGHALEEYGHTFQMFNLNEDWPEADYIMYQSEWDKHLKPRLTERKEKKICWLGHFTPSARYDMPKLEEIDADMYFTQWKGECVELAERLVIKPILYIPHGWCGKCNTRGKVIEAPKAVFIGADYKERSLDWNDYAFVTRVTCPHDEAKDYYRSAIVSPNLHGSFQKNQVTEYMQVPGTMINDRIYRICLCGAFFITRAKDNMDFRRLYSHKTDKSKGILCDQTIMLNGHYAAKHYPEKMRRIKFFDQETQKTLVFLTNNFYIEATEVAQLYKHRWKIELFFKWIKQHLKIKSFWGQSENAVKTQVWIAISVYVLVAIAKKRLALKQSLYEVLQILSISIFEKMPINQLFQLTQLQYFKEQNHNQLNMFDL